MSKIKNGELDQYGAEPFDQQQIGTVEGVNKPCFCVSQVIGSEDHPHNYL